MPKRTTDFHEDLLTDLADPQEAAEYLNAANEDSPEMVLVALRDIAEARQMARVAEGAGVAREALYRMLRKSGNPTYTSLMGILNSVGLRIVFTAAAPTSIFETRLTSGANNSISGLVGTNGAIRQEDPETHTLNSSLGSVPKSSLSGGT